MSNLYSGLRQQAMSPMYGMSQPQSGFIPGGSYDPYQGMGGYGGGFGGGFPGMGGGYSMFGSYNAMPDYTGGYMPGYGSQLPSQFGGGVSQFGGMSQFGGGFGGYGMQPMQPNVNDLFGQYMFGQYYGQPSFNPFQATSMFGAGGGRGFGGGQRRGSREQFGGMQQPGGEAGVATTGQGFGADDYRQMANVSARQQSPFEGLELDIDALRAALGLSGQSPASPTAQITPNEDLSRGAAQTPAAPQPAPQPRPPMVPPVAPTQPPMQIPPNLNLFVPGFAGFDEGAGRQVQAPVEVSGFAPPPTQAVLPETGGEGRFYTEQPTFSMTMQPTPVAQMPEFAPVAQPPTTMPQFSMGAMDNLAAARQAALMARQRGRG